ncbi:hypothetical protein ACFO8O_02180 [Hephaestia sp. GCM10023244]|uniref:hypothetical protein n=1 Tax=unclassified Hephaestia TaxID=2631281 RepID=UPI0020775DE5|nr:hypothetical protein [Hephaestia sp. MAHUQ-44]MCM8729780.1 hypothetical protein [Hephaestia sp. MAHUQ-44]
MKSFMAVPMLMFRLIRGSRTIHSPRSLPAATPICNRAFAVDRFVERLTTIAATSDRRRRRLRPMKTGCLLRLAQQW